MSNQLRYPPDLVEFPDGTVTFAEVTQDSDDCIRSADSLLCDVRPGQLSWDKKRGTPSPNGIDIAIAQTMIETALVQQEPRAPVAVRLVDNGDGTRQVRLKLVTV